MSQPKPPWLKGKWPTVRRSILERDGYLCQIQSDGCTRAANHVDHIVSPHIGGAWWDPNNLRASCGHCNLTRSDQNHPEAWRRSDTEIILVVGPPCSGKSTFVAQHKADGDLVVDYDAIAVAIGGAPHSHGDAPHPVINKARNALLRQIRTGKTNARRAWIISANPNAENLFPFHRVEVLDPGEDECLRKASTPGVDRQNLVGVIRSWYRGRQGSSPRMPAPSAPSRSW